MIHFERSYGIARPPASVFAVLTDVVRLPEWQKGTVEVEQLTPGPMGVGTRLREVHAVMRRRMESIVEVVSYEPDRLFALHVVEGAPIDGRWELAPHGDGTELTFSAHGRAPRLLGPLLRRQFDAHHGRLKELVERY